MTRKVSYFNYSCQAIELEISALRLLNILFPRFYIIIAWL